MATYYKYAERNATSQINWYEVGKDITDMLQEEKRIREEKKAQIDEASRAFGQELANAPTGEETTMNAWALDYASNAQEARLLQDRLLKSGALKLKDYNIMRQNITDGTKNAFSLVEDYQKEYKDKMERFQKGDSQALELWYMAQAEGFLNFAKSSLYINPTDFTVNVAKKNDDGSMSNEFATINDMRNRLRTKFNYFDWDAETNSYVKNLGDFGKVIQDAGGYTNIKDQNFKNRLDESMNLTFESYAAKNPYNFTSILTNDIGGVGGKGYTFTFDEKAAAADESLILLKKDPNNPNGPALPDFTTDNGKKQKQAVTDFLKKQTIVKLGSTETYTQKTQRYSQEWESKRADKNKQDKATAKAWNDMFSSADASTKNAAAEFIIGLPQNKEAGIIEISTSGNNLVIKYADPKQNRTIPMPKTLEDWSKIGSEFTGITDANKIFDLSGGGDRKSSAQGTMSISAKRAMADEEASTVSDKDIFDKVSASVDNSFDEDNATEMADALLGEFSEYGFVFTPDEETGPFGTKDNIDVFGPDGQLMGTYKVDDSSQLAKLKSDIVAKIKANDKLKKLFAPTGTPNPSGASNSGGNARG